MQLIGVAGKAGHGKDTIADYLVETYGFLKFSFSQFLRDEIAAAYELTDAERDILTDRATKEIPSTRLRLRLCKDPEFVNLALVLIECTRTAPGQFLDRMELPLPPRQVQIWWGTEYRRAQDPDYWVKKAGEYVDAFIEARKHTVTAKDQKSITKQLFPQWKKGDKLLSVGYVYYMDFPGLVNSSVRFDNECKWIHSREGQVWFVDRPGFVQNFEADQHSSEVLPTVRTGDKMIINAGSVGRLKTAVTLALQGESVINTIDEE